MSENYTTIRTEGEWHIDQNDNKWSANIFSASQAEHYSETMVECHHCINCYYCHFCSDCVDCEDCRGCRGCSNCSSCNFCVNCRDCCKCHDCSLCQYCGNFYENPQRIIGWEMGSRNDHPTVYWTAPGEEQCVVGCFRGNLNELECEVRRVHANNPEHLQSYLKFINSIRIYQEACAKE